MSVLSRDHILTFVHPLSDATVARIIATGATEGQFRQARAIYARNRASRVHGDVSNDAVGHVVAILERTTSAGPGSLLGEAGSTLT